MARTQGGIQAKLIKIGKIMVKAVSPPQFKVFVKFQNHKIITYAGYQSNNETIWTKWQF